MADSVMRMPVNNQTFFSPKPISISSLQRKCKDCEDEDKKVQRKETNRDLSVEDASTENYIGSLNGKGRPLTQNERSFFEPRFGHDFSDVKIHNNTDAGKSAQSVNALAYTAGNHIVFNHNQFAPESDSGKKLLAHELTHVVQQKKLQSTIQRQDINEDNEEQLVSFAGTGSYTRNTTHYANCENVSVQGNTTANYTNDFSSDGSQKMANGCQDCTEDDNCIESKGTITSIFTANPVVTLPTPPGGLNQCETDAVQNFIDTTLNNHEQQHVTRFNKYNGTIKTPYSYKGCVSGLDAYIKSIHDSIEVARRNKSDADSGALDKNGANVFPVTCNCPDKDAGN